MKSVKLYAMGKNFDINSRKIGLLPEMRDWLNEHDVTGWIIGEGQFTLYCETGFYVPLHLRSEELAVQLLLTFPDLLWKEEPPHWYPGG